MPNGKATRPRATALNTKGTPAKGGPSKAGTPAKGEAAGGTSGASGTAKADAGASSTAKPEKRKEMTKAASTKPPTTAQLKEYGFKVLGPIAAGAFSTIVRAQHIESKTEVAVKTFAKCTGPEAEEHERELSVLRLIAETRHAHIANLLAEYEVPNLGTCAMLFYCSQGSLKAHLGKLAKKQKAMGEESAVTVVAQVASALTFLHANGVAHRDLKPGNILHDGRRWRICDFGFAVVCDDKPLKKSCGTLVYSAPELLFSPGGNGELNYNGKHVDLWAFGCIVYEMRIGRTAFVAPDEQSLKLRIKEGFKGGSMTHPWLPHMKGEKTLIKELLQLDPAKRMPAEKVLQHKWVASMMSPTVETSAGKAAIEAATQNWWCDAAASGCLRPTEHPEGGGTHAAEHRCWGDGQGYMVCEVCYRAGKAETDNPLEQMSGPVLSIADAKAAAEEGMRNAMAADAAAAADAPPPMSAEAAAARAVEVERLALELEALKEKHCTGSRLEACLLELEAARKAAGESTAPAAAAAALHGQTSDRSSGQDSASPEGGEADADAVAAKAAEVERLALELVALKEKHQAGSRLEACLLELDEVRKRAAAAKAPQPVAESDAVEVSDADAVATEAANAAEAEAEAEAAARAAEVDRLSHELVALKEKHNASSRLEACLLELEEVRNSKAALEEELKAVKEQLSSK